MALTQRGFQTYDGSHAPGFVKDGNFELNKDSPLYDDSLVLALAPFAGAGFKNFAPSDVAVTSSGAEKFTTNTIGEYGFKFQKAADGSFATLSPFISISNGYTISLVYDALPSVPLGFSTIAYSDIPFNVHLWATSSNDNLAVWDSTTREFSPTCWPTTFPARVTATYDGTTARCYIDGIEQGTVAAAFSGDIQHILGDNANDRAWSPCLRFEIWNRVLSPAEVFLAHGPATHWQFYAETGRVSYFFVPAAVGGLSIPVAMYSYRRHHQSGI